MRRRDAGLELPAIGDKRAVDRDVRDAREKGIPPNLGSRLGLSVAEAAHALGVSVRHLRQELPRIPHLHLGRRVVIPVDALREWLQAEARAYGRRVDQAVSAILDDVALR